MSEELGLGVQSLTVFIWSHPRALSTALLRSLAELPGSTTVLEPFMIPWQADIGFLDRERRPDPPSFEDIIQNIIDGEYFTHGAQRVQIVKDMGCHVTTPVLERLLARMPDAKHVFLARHPYRTIPSYFSAIRKDPQFESFTKDVIFADIAYKPLLDCAECIQRSLGAGSLLVLDADMFIQDAERPLRLLCDHIGVPFTRALLQWQPNAVPSSWRDLDAFEGWLDNVISSPGWIPNPSLSMRPAYPECEGIQQECIDTNMPFYEQLLQLAKRC